MKRRFALFLALFTPACATDEANDADEGAEESESASEDEIGSEGETDESGSEESSGEESSGESGDTDESGSEESGDTEYGHGNLHPDCMGDTPRVVFETNMGTMTLELDAVRAPITVANFLGYVSSGWYDGTIFHRVIDGFVVQGGGYEPGLIEKQTLGPIVLEIHPELLHVDGAIAMARRDEPDTAESQWYITDGAQPGLDGSYAVFGVIIEGFDVRNAISAVAVADVGQLGDVPVEDVVLEAAYCVVP